MLAGIEFQHTTSQYNTRNIKDLNSATDIRVFNCTHGFLTFACPEILNLLTVRNMGGLTDSQFETEHHASRKRSLADELILGSSSESLSSSPSESSGTQQNLFKKLVKLREKIIANSEHLNLKKRFAPKRKRSVSFADDRGLPLEEVRVVDEKCNGEDNTSSAETTTCTSGEASTATDFSITPWITAFFQPIFDKRKMKRTFADKGVALETVDIENARLSGTIKVDLSATNDRVFVRYTKDSWKTYCDVTAKAVPSEVMDRSRADTERIYTFEFDIPERVLHVQFAVCSADARGKGHWDDNEGANYILLHHSCLDDGGKNSGSESESDSLDDRTKL